MKNKNYFISNTGIVRDKRTFNIIGTGKPPTRTNKLKFIWSVLKRELKEIATAASYAINH